MTRSAPRVRHAPRRTRPVPRAEAVYRTEAGRNEARIYVKQLNPVLDIALDARAMVVSRLAEIANDAVGAGVVLLRAGQIGSSGAQTLQRVRDAARQITPPASAQRAHEALEAWLNHLIAGCETLATASRHADVHLLGTGSAQILAASQYARRFNLVLRALRDRHMGDRAA